MTTNSFDITGDETSRSGSVPSREAVLEAIGRLRGEYMQTPPAYSAKKVGGRRAYDFARDDEDVVLTPVAVRVSRAELTGFSGERAMVTLTSSPGFYVRDVRARARSTGWHRRLPRSAQTHAERRVQTGRGVDD